MPSLGLIAVCIVAFLLIAFLFMQLITALQAVCEIADELKEANTLQRSHNKTARDMLEAQWVAIRKLQKLTEKD